MAKITKTRVTKKGQRGVVHCDECDTQHKIDAGIANLVKIISKYERMLCKECCQAWHQPVGRTDVCCWLLEHGLSGWYGVREATQDEAESIYRAMCIRDAGLKQYEEEL